MASLYCNTNQKVICIFGARQTIIVEPSTISEEYEIVWRRHQVDLDELIYRRTVEKLNYKQLAAYFKYSKHSILLTGT